jgi:hypothetical protein
MSIAACPPPQVRSTSGKRRPLRAPTPPFLTITPQGKPR